MKKNDKIDIQVWAHWKQGDDFGCFLKEFSPAKALEMWGKSLIQTGKDLIKGSEILSAGNYEGQADSCTHHIGFYNVDRALAEKLCEISVFSEDPTPSEDEEWFDDEEEFGLTD